MNSIYCGEDMSIVDDRRDSFDQNTIVHLYCIIILVHSIDRKNVLKQNVLPNRHFSSFDEWNGHLHYVFNVFDKTQFRFGDLLTSETLMTENVLDVNTYDIKH